MSQYVSKFAICMLLAIAVSVPAAAQDRMVPVNEGAASMSTSQAARMTPAVRVFREASPAVVNLSTTQVVTVRRRAGFGSLFDEIFEMPTAPQQYRTHSVGSGFLIHSDGYIVTNAHVVDRATEVKATFADGIELDAEEVAIDRRRDLAVLKVNANRPLPHLKLGRSDDLMQGEPVIVIGNPLGYQHTVTTGVVSAVDRELAFDADHVYRGLIQSDASINPGNSGGPMLNILGELIGINTAIRGDAQNIGFAIPVNQLRELLPQMLDIERVRRVDFGLHFDGQVRGALNEGVRVLRVDNGTPAAKAGVQTGDLITAIDNQPTPNFVEAFSLLARTPPGQSLKLDIRRESGDQVSVEVPLREIPVGDAVAQMERFFGMTVRPMNKGDLQRLGVQRSIGLIVDGVKNGSEADRERLVVGDVITQFGGWGVTDLEGLSHLIDQVDPGDIIPVQILRVSRNRLVRFELGLRAQ